MVKNYASQTELDLLYKHLIDSTQYLSLDYDVQCRKSSLPNDLIPDDIANDWEWIVTISKILNDNGRLTNESLTLIEYIDKRFDDVSLGSIAYNEDIWTSNGLKIHSFWQEQRKLAESLLSQLVPY